MHGIKSCQTKGKALIAAHEIKWSCVLIAESIKMAEPVTPTKTAWTGIPVETVAVEGFH